MTVKPTEIRVWSGNYFDYHNMKNSPVKIEDIAHALSMQCRFNGHVDQFYSVAQHSVLVSHHVQPENAFCGLMHDATEAYIGDMASPLKSLIPQFCEVEKQVWEVLAKYYNLPVKLPEDVKNIDRKACLKEAMDLMGVQENDWSWGIPALDGPRIQPMPAFQARRAFLHRFYELTTSEAA